MRIWSMEQAHYLLNRLRANNDGMRTRQLTAEELDPNATNGLRLESLQTRLDVAGTFDQANALSNKLAIKDFQERVPKREENRQQLDTLQERLSAGSPSPSSAAPSRHSHASNCSSANALPSWWVDMIADWTGNTSLMSCDVNRPPPS